MSADASGGIRTDPGQTEIRLADDAVEVEDRRRVATGCNRRRRLGIGVRGRTVDRAWEEDVEGGAKTGENYWADAWNRILFRARPAPCFPATIIVVVVVPVFVVVPATIIGVVVAENRGPEPGAEHASGGASADAKEPAT